jgi:Family of unknown function (DUF6502)
MDIPQPTPSGQPVLDQALLVTQPLVRWLLRSGVGYAEFTNALKTVFLQEAEAELQRIHGKRNDSTRSMLSGLHRKDVRALLPGVLASLETGTTRADARSSRPTLASKVVTRWLAQELPECLPVTGPAPSFETLSREVSQDVHPRAVLIELVRLGVVQESDQTVTLQRAAFVPNPAHTEARQMMTASVADHLAAGVSNVTQARAGSFLEQSVFAEGLHPQSVQVLEKLAASLWPQIMKTMVKAATPLYENDEATGGDQRFRLGMFSYSAPLNAEAPKHTADDTEE